MNPRSCLTYDEVRREEESFRSEVEDFCREQGLVLIDPDNREQVERLVAASWPHAAQNRMVDALQVGLRSLLTPPKPPEPQGLGAVVEDADGVLWVRHQTTGGGGWYVNGVTRTWDRISAVRVLSEGVTE